MTQAPTRRPLPLQALIFLPLSSTYISINLSFTFCLIAIANGASAVGRLLSGVLTIKYGPLNIMTIFTIFAAVFTYIWPFIKTDGAFVTITCLYGISHGTFISLFLVSVAQVGETHDIGWTVMALGTYLLS